MVKQREIEEILKEYEDMQRIFKEIDDNARSISKFIDKLINQSVKEYESK